MSRTMMIAAWTPFFFALISTSFPALVLGGQPREHRRLLDAIRAVESNGNDRAVGDQGRSRGPYQISRGYWTAACQEGKVRWNYDRLVWDRARSEQIVCWYWTKHHAASDQQRARIHNGGPKGMSKTSTQAYWNKTKAAMTAAERTE